MNSSEIEKLTPCPKSPNCVCTQDPIKRKQMEPIPFSTSAENARQNLKSLIESYDNAVLVKSETNYFHYEFTTKLGKFIDEVEFLIDSEAKLIHFRSASRKGYGDFGKNKRRMKGITASWQKKHSNS